MKKIIPFVLLATIFASCKQDLNKKMTETISPYVVKQLGADEKTFHLSVYKIDTLTEKFKIQMQGDAIYTNYMEKEDPIFQILKDAVERTKQAYDLYPDAFADKYNKAVEEMETKRQEILPIVNKIEELNKKHQVADSTTFLAYSVHAISQYTDSYNVEKKDSVRVIVNKDFKIIEKHDFIK